MTSIELVILAAERRANAAATAVQAAIEAQAQAAFLAMWQALVNDPTMSPREAIAAAQAKFSGEFTAELAKAFSELLQRAVGTAEVRAMPVGEITLSERLYNHTQQVTNEVAALVKAHAKGVTQARELSRQLYDGYDQKDGIQRPLEGKARGQLPKELRALTDYLPARRELTALQVQGQQQAARLKSQALRAAYLESFAAWENGAGLEALKKRLDVAQREKNRFLADRIAQTELHRAHQSQVAQDLMADTETTVVQVRLNPAHPKTDICDLHGRADLWGLGPGNYPKSEAPVPPFHPFCWCRLRSMPSLSAANAQHVPGGEAAYLRKIGPVAAGRVMGSAARAHMVLDGEHARTVADMGKPAAYRTTLVGDRKAHALVGPPAPPPLEIPPPAVRVFEAQATVKDAAAWAVRNGLADAADYTGIKPEVANTWNESMFEHLQLFPELRKNQRFIGTGQAQYSAYYEDAVQAYTNRLLAVNPGMDRAKAEVWARKRVKQPKVSGNVWAHSWAQPKFSGVAVNRKWGADVEGFKGSLARCMASQFHPIGCDTIRSVADHEIGHQLDTLLDLSMDSEVRKAFTEATRNGIKDQVSEYAGKNIGEFIAECWAESLNNPAPRTFAARIAAIIRSRYAAKFS